MIALLVLTDGRRDCIERTIPSALANLAGPITTKVIWDDSDNDDYFEWLERFHADGFTVARGSSGRSGFGGAIQRAWGHLLANTDEPYVFHLEDDFTFNRQIRLDRMAATLTAQPYLAQLALRRQPWNDIERAAGGIVEQNPGAYTDWQLPLPDRALALWLEHSQFFTTNPCLYRRELMGVGWPDGAESEGRWGFKLKEQGLPWGVPGDDVRFGFWGARNSGEWVAHLGHERVGVGY